mmetsp:Transcript_19503/g.41138  ORF Transcript_19503/g.41138 Transcript_19503/m.41138 type:complete len:86 (-) Transcript_19503:106-363(-)
MTRQLLHCLVAEPSPCVLSSHQTEKSLFVFLCFRTISSKVRTGVAFLFSYLLIIIHDHYLVGIFDDPSRHSRAIVSITNKWSHRC